MKKLLFCLLISFSVFCQHHSIKKGKKAFSLELGGTSPIGSGNFEYICYSNERSFVNLQIGFGIISSRLDDYSIPHSITYNYWLNKPKKPKNKLKCNPKPPKEHNEHFFELGYGQTIHFNQKDWRTLDYRMPIIGFRSHLTKYSKEEFIFKLRYTPNLVRREVVGTFFGIAIGKVI
jgi:hypothetical protein